MGEYYHIMYIQSIEERWLYGSDNIECQDG